MHIAYVICLILYNIYEYVWVRIYNYIHILHMFIICLVTKYYITESNKNYIRMPNFYIKIYYTFINYYIWYLIATRS